MSSLGTDFQFGTECQIQLGVPPLAKQVLGRISEICHTQKICIAGGFLRGLYMRQYLGLDPRMKDVDVFVDLPLNTFDDVRPALIAEFGPPIRFHVGQFGTETQPHRGLIEFALPEALRPQCANVESVQLNFGPNHVWADPSDYIAQANAGINQIAMSHGGGVMVSPLFIDDMQHRRMTMNPHRCWSVHEWQRTADSLERMCQERPEFRNWTRVLVAKPFVPPSGSFWEGQQPVSP